MNSSGRPIARSDNLAPAKTIFATNTSTLLPSELMESTGRPERFLALHFANQIWIQNTAEVMGTPKTDPDVYRTIVAFASAIGMVPIELKKEHPKYVLNSLLTPFLDDAVELLADGVADPETVDKTWRIATRSSLGPFQILDMVGLRTVYNIDAAGNEKQQRLARFLKENYIDKGSSASNPARDFIAIRLLKTDLAALRVAPPTLLLSELPLINEIDIVPPRCGIE